MCITKRSFSCLHVQRITCLSPACTGKTVEWLMPREENCPNCVEQAKKAELKASILNCTLSDVLEAISSFLNTLDQTTSPVTQLKTSDFDSDDGASLGAKFGKQPTAKSKSPKSPKFPNIPGKFRSRNELKSTYAKMIMKRDAKIHDLKTAVTKIGLHENEFDAKLQEAGTEREQGESEAKAVRDTLKAEKAAKHAALMKEQEDAKQARAAEKEQEQKYKQKVTDLTEVAEQRELSFQNGNIAAVLEMIANKEVATNATGDAKGQGVVGEKAGQIPNEERKFVWRGNTSNENAAKEDATDDPTTDPHVLSLESENGINGASPFTLQGANPVDNDDNIDDGNNDNKKNAPGRGAQVNRFAQKEAARSAAAARRLAGGK